MGHRRTAGSRLTGGRRAAGRTCPPDGRNRLPIGCSSARSAPPGITPRSSGTRRCAAYARRCPSRRRSSGSPGAPPRWGRRGNDDSECSAPVRATLRVSCRAACRGSDRNPECSVTLSPAYTADERSPQDASCCSRPVRTAGLQSVGVELHFRAGERAAAPMAGRRCTHSAPRPRPGHQGTVQRAAHGVWFQWRSSSSTMCGPDGLHVAPPKAHVHQRDATFGVDDERGGHAGQIIGGCGRAPRVAQNFVVHGIALQELQRIVNPFIHVDCDDFEAAAPKSCSRATISGTDTRQGGHQDAQKSM